MTAHFDQFFCVSELTDRFQSLYQINRNDKCVKTDDNARNIIWGRVEWTLTGVHHTFDRLLSSGGAVDLASFLLFHLSSYCLGWAAIVFYWAAIVLYEMGYCLWMRAERVAIFVF